MGEDITTCTSPDALRTISSSDDIDYKDDTDSTSTENDAANPSPLLLHTAYCLLPIAYKQLDVKITRIRPVTLPSTEPSHK